MVTITYNSIDNTKDSITTQVNVINYNKELNSEVWKLRSGKWVQFEAEGSKNVGLNLGFDVQIRIDRKRQIGTLCQESQAP